MQTGRVRPRRLWPTLWPLLLSAPPLPPPPPWRPAGWGAPARQQGSRHPARPPLRPRLPQPRSSSGKLLHLHHLLLLLSCLPVTSSRGRVCPKVGRLDRAAMVLNEVSSVCVSLHMHINHIQTHTLKTHTCLHSGSRVCEEERRARTRSVSVCLSVCVFAWTVTVHSVPWGMLFPWRRCCCCRSWIAAAPRETHGHCTSEPATGTSGREWATKLHNLTRRLRLSRKGLLG